MKFNKVFLILSLAIIFMISMGVVSANESSDLTEPTIYQSDSSDFYLDDDSDYDWDDDSDYDWDDDSDYDWDDDSDYDWDDDWDDDSDYDWDDDWDDDSDYDFEYNNDIAYSNFTGGLGTSNRFDKLISFDDKAPQDDMDSNKNYPVLSCGGSFTSNDHTNKAYKDGILRKNTPKAPRITYKTAEVYLSTEEFNNNFEISNYIIVNDGKDILKIFKPSVLGNIDFTSLAAVSNQFNMGLLTLIVSFLHNIFMLI